MVVERIGIGTGIGASPKGSDSSAPGNARGGRRALPKALQGRDTAKWVGPLRSSCLRRSPGGAGGLLAKGATVFGGKPRALLGDRPSHGVRRSGVALGSIAFVLPPSIPRRCRGLAAGDQRPGRPCIATGYVSSSRGCISPGGRVGSASRPEPGEVTGSWPASGWVCGEYSPNGRGDWRDGFSSSRHPVRSRRYPCRLR